MIAADQPSIFGPGVRVYLSSSGDGTMKDGSATSASLQTVGNYETFLTQRGIDPGHATYMTLTLDDYLTGHAFTRYRAVQQDDPGHGPADPLLGFDAITTDQPGRALAAPPADCPVAVIYDPIKHAVMVSHLGRHSVEQSGALCSVEFMMATYGSDPADLQAWVSPGPNADAYPMWAFENRSIHAVIAQQLRQAGITESNIELCSVDTVTDTNYFSHSEFLKGNRATDGRYLVCAVLV